MTRQRRIRLLLFAMLLAFSVGDAAMADGRAVIFSNEANAAEVAKAEKVSRKQLAAARKLPEGSLARAQALLNCVRGVTHYEALKDEKESILKEVVDTMQKRLPANDLRTADAEYELGHSYYGNGNGQHSYEEWYLKAIPGFEHHFDKVLVSSALSNQLQEMYFSTNQTQKVNALACEQYTRWKTNKAIDHGSLMRGLWSAIHTSEAAKDYKQVEIDLRKCLDVEGNSSTSHDLAKLHSKLGLALQNQGLLKDALGEFNTALAIDEKVFPNPKVLVPNHVLSGPYDDTSPIAEDFVRIGDLYSKQGKQAEARTNFNKAWDTIKDFNGKGLSKPFIEQQSYIKQRCAEPAAQH